MPDVVALGEVLVDFTCRSVDEKGYPTLVGHPGGAPANFLAALSKFGVNTALIGKVGTDVFGRMLIDTLKDAGIDTRGIVLSEDVFTTLAFVTLDVSGDREFSFARKPGADTMLRFNELDLKMIDEAKVFHFGTLSMTDEPAKTTTYEAVNYAKKRGKLLTFDPNLRTPLWKSLDDARAQILWGLGHADVVKISDEELEFLFGLPVREGAQKIISDYGVSLVFVTCGADGCWYKNNNAEGHVDGLKGISVLDTTGAGDIFGGAAVYQLLRIGKSPDKLYKEELEEICRFASVSAGLSTTKAGGISSVPELDEICKIIKADRH